MAAKLVYDLMGLVPQNYTELKKVLKNVVRYIVQIYPDYLHKMSQADKKQFAAICRKHFFEDICLFQSINKHHKIEYLKCLLGM